MKSKEQINNEIKSTLYHQANHMEPNKDLFNQIRLNIYEKEQQEVMKNKKFSFKNRKKLIAAAIACLALTSITIIGASLGKSWVSYTGMQYQEFPSTTVLKQDVGFIPKYTQELPGGFEYKNGGFGTAELLDETQNALTETSHISFLYERKQDKQQLMLNAEQIEQQYLTYGTTEIVENYNNIPLYYHQQTYKFVPEDYNMTEEDQQAIESGKLQISIGSQEVEIQNYQNLSWYEQGINYSLSAFDGEYTVEQMTEMAKHIINQN